MENNKIDDGGPAFPCPEASLAHFNESTAYMGLTMRDYFAAAALPLAYAHWKSYNDKEKDGEQPRESLVAEEAYTIADAMIKVKKENI
jgi:hypothetical protein